MRPDFWGDSYDIVKRFLLGTLATSGCERIALPMFTETVSPGEIAAFEAWDGIKREKPTRRGNL